MLLKLKAHCHYPQPVLTWQLEPGPACSVMTYSRQATLLATGVLCVPQPGSGSVTCCTVHCTVLYTTVHCTHCTDAESTLIAAMANNNMTIVGEDRGIHPAENRTNHLCLHLTTAVNCPRPRQSLAIPFIIYNQYIFWKLGKVKQKQYNRYILSTSTMAVLHFLNFALTHLAPVDGVALHVAILFQMNSYRMSI